jgi:DNA polymerase
MVRFFPGETITKTHGKARKRGGTIYYPLYHPAAALHQRSLQEIIKADTLKIPSLLAEAEGVCGLKEKPQQLSMF